MITFRAGPGAILILYDEIASELIGAMGRQLQGPGEVSVEELSGTLARLRQTFEDSVTRAPLVNRPQPAANGLYSAFGHRSEISLAERAVPLIELFERAQRTRDPVSWS